MDKSKELRRKGSLSVKGLMQKEIGSETGTSEIHGDSHYLRMALVFQCGVVL